VQSISDPAIEEALVDVPTLCRFPHNELISDRIHDEVTTSTFRQLLEKQQLEKQTPGDVKSHLNQRGMTMCLATTINLTLIAAPSSINNKKW
jgi:IS5 family transposase